MREEGIIQHCGSLEALLGGQPYVSIDVLENLFSYFQKGIPLLTVTEREIKKKKAVSYQR